MDDFYSPTQPSLHTHFMHWRERRRRKSGTEVKLEARTLNYALRTKTDTKQPLVILVPRNQTRSSLMGLRPNNNPFEQTLREYDQGHKRFTGSRMEHYYNDFQPKSAAAVLQLENSKLSELHADAAVLPWWAVADQTQFSDIRPQDQRLRYKHPERYGLDANIDYGCQFYGPVSKGVGELEFRRHVETHQLISKNGYLPYLHGHLTGQFLLSENKCAWVCHKGNHRYVSLLALGLETLPVAFSSKKGTPVVVRRDDVTEWPNVANGLFTKKEALQVFDRFLDPSDSFPNFVK